MSQAIVDMMQLQRDYVKPFGRWRVDANDDRIQFLGIYEGNVDEIALHLADKQGYGLNFERLASLPEKLLPTGTGAIVSFGAPGFSNLTPEQRQMLLADVYQSRPVRIQQSAYYAAVQIQAGKTTLEEEKIEKVAKVAAIMNKLNAEDAAVLRECLAQK